eukprot:COSAG06_NODE_23829_length_680_cov_1.220310_2_plen_67_part_01
MHHDRVLPDDRGGLRCSVETPQAAGSVWRCTVPAYRISPSTSQSCSACMRPPTPPWPAVLLLSFVRR